MTTQPVHLKGTQIHINGFHHTPGALLQMLTCAGGSDNNNVSFPHEDTSTVTGRGGNSSGFPRMRIGKGVDRTWETGGEKVIKEMKVQECQISGLPLTTPLVLPDTCLLGIFLAQSFSE